MTRPPATPRSVAATIIGAALVIGSCSSNDADSTTTTTSAPVTTPAPTTTSPTTTTVVETTTTEATTTTVAEPNTVGDPEALREEIEALLAAMKRLGDVGKDVAPFVPDLTNPDPVAALQQAWEFEHWTVSVQPDPEWVPFYNYPDSPHERETASWASDLLIRGVRSNDIRDSYRFHGGSVAPFADLDVPEAIQAELPEGSVAIVFESELLPYTLIDVGTNEVVEERPGFPRTAWLAILAPTPTGWKIYSNAVHTES